MKKESKGIKYKQRTISVWNEVAPFYHKRWAKNEVGPFSVTKKLLELSKIKKENTVLDLACGTGLVTKKLIRKVGSKGFETGKIDMMTDGTEKREFLYAEDCCEALEKVMEEYETLDSDDNLHITSFHSTTILEIANIIRQLFLSDHKIITLIPSEAKDEVQKDARNEADPYILKLWKPKTSIRDGIKIDKKIKMNKKTRINKPLSGSLANV